MEWYIIISLAALFICLASCLFHFVRLVRLGKPVDYSVQAGDTSKAVLYSFTGAMSPSKKESAYLHMPTYTAGILYHLGTFTSILCFFISIIGVALPGAIRVVLMILAGAGVVSGLLILLKRILNRALRSLSNADDFISNILVTVFQALTVLTMLFSGIEPAYYLSVSLLMLYLPLGKLKHAVYFFAARYHLGYFHGYRGTWPPVKHNS